MLIEFTNKGIFCPRAGVYIDPWKPVEKAIITHAHSDHARPGSRHYLCHTDSASILRHRLGGIQADTLPYGKVTSVKGVDISLHPAGHITGSAQVRLAYKGEVWVVSGDYKVVEDGYTVPFEPVRCTHFVTESTFGLPVYHFPTPEEIDAQLNAWTEENAQLGYNSVILGYALGKSQRILSALDTVRPVLLHTSVYNTNEALGFDNTPYMKFTQEFSKSSFSPGIVVAPSSALGSSWLRRFEPYRLGVCSGWMQLRGARRRSNADKGFVMSDHADWEGLNKAVLATGATNIYVTHGYQAVFSQWLRERYGLNAMEVQTQFEGESMQGITTGGEDLKPQEDQ
jgi:putative mRNA 3-end processing factor